MGIGKSRFMFGGNGGDLEREHVTHDEGRREGFMERT